MSFSADSLRARLWPATLVYLAIPEAIFATGALRPAAAVLVDLALAVGVFEAIRRRRGARVVPTARISKGALVAAALPFVAMLALGVLLIAIDPVGEWKQRFEEMNDWVRQPWPVIYRTAAGLVAQVYYPGWFLPAAPAASVGGWSAVMALLFVWSAVGYLLAGAWLVALARAHPVLATCVFVGFSGIQIGPNLVHDGLRHTLHEVFKGHLFVWQHYFWYYPVHGSFDRPHHTLSAWLIASVTMDGADRRDAAFPGVLLVALALLWSPFTALGVLPLLAGQWLSADGSLVSRLRAQVNAANGAGAVVGLTILAYYAARWFPYSLPDVYLQGVTRTHNGLWLTQPGVHAGEFLRTWLVFVSLYVLVLAVPILCAARLWPRPSPRAALVLAATLFLVLVPLVHYGYYNDLPRNSGLAAQFVLLVEAAGLLAHIRRHPFAATALAVGLALGVLTTTTQLIRTTRGLRAAYERRGWLSPPSHDIFERQLMTDVTHFDRINQYLGSVDSPFFRWLARPAQPRTIEPTPAGRQRTPGSRREEGAP